MRVFDRSEKRVVGDLKNAWETGGFETEQGPMVLQRCFKSSKVTCKTLEFVGTIRGDGGGYNCTVGLMICMYRQQINKF